jgi:hypothetical protein
VLCCIGEKGGRRCLAVSSNVELTIRRAQPFPAFRSDPLRTRSTAKATGGYVETRRGTSRPPRPGNR